VSATALIAIDWGTTAARAYRLSHGGEVVDAREAALGVQHVPDGDFPLALTELLGDWAELDVPRIASGMVGSRQGWIEAPYLPCPARIAELAAALARTPAGELRIVPGIATRDASGMPDVMRGEETQLAGLDAGSGVAIAVLPGTHSKWARVEGGAIADFRTFMTGDAYGALLEHTILGRLATRGTGTPDSRAFGQGVARGLAGGELLHDAFCARTLALMGDLASDDVADWLSGLLIGHEIGAARAWVGALPAETSPVAVIGSEALVERYRRALAQAGVDARPGPADAAVRGLWRIAHDARLIR
jgi:2-dehydro-3-deoxygalactonokinase